MKRILMLILTVIVCTSFKTSESQSIEEKIKEIELKAEKIERDINSLKKIY